MAETFGGRTEQEGDRAGSPDVRRQGIVGQTALEERPSVVFVLTTKYGNAVAANTWNTEIWKPALARAGVIPPRVKGAKPWQWQAAPKDGFHVLRTGSMS